MDNLQIDKYGGGFFLKNAYARHGKHCILDITNIQNIGGRIRDISEGNNSTNNSGNN